MPRRRLLVSAYGCEPGKGSEQGVGWNWVLQLARLGDIVVLTRANNRKVIEAQLPAELEGRVRFLYYDLPNWLRVFKRRERGLYIYYLFWQWGAYRLARREVARQPVDYAIHLTFGSVWLPTFLHRLPAPFIWGPVGGGEAVPWPLIRTLPPRARVLQYVRYLLMATFAVNPLVSGPARKARVILARTRDTARILPARHADKVRVVLETAAADAWFERFAHVRAKQANGPLQVIYTGRLVAFKNLDMAIQAVANARRHGVALHFTIVGDGALQPQLQQLAAEEGISDAVTFTGRLTQLELFDRLARSDIYLFPSLREGGPWSLMEAMASGLPSICVDTSGMSVIADDACARMVAPGTPKAMIAAFTDALRALAADADLRAEMGVNARRRLERDFRWDRKGDFMAQLFAELEKTAP